METDRSRALAALQVLYTSSQQEIDAAQKEHDEVTVRLEAAQQRQKALEGALRAYGVEPEGPEEAIGEEKGEEAALGVSQNGSVDWPSLSRAAAVREVLRERGPLTPSQISQALAAHGRRNDNARYVSAAIARMAEYGHLKSAGEGRWRVIKPRENEKE